RYADFANVVEKCRDFKILKCGSFEAELLADAHAPFSQTCAMDSGVEIFQVKELIECADHGAAQRRGLLFQLLDSEGLRRHKKRGASRRRRNLTLQHEQFTSRATSMSLSLSLKEYLRWSCSLTWKRLDTRGCGRVSGP